jgi:DNA-binding Xre family transcriptional regulator
LLVKNGKGFEIVSGFHRVAALKEFDYEKVPVRVLTVPEGTTHSNLEAGIQLIGLSENEHSGSPLKMTKRDRLKTLKRMLSNPIYQAMSSTRLAELTGISDKTITALKKELGVDPDKIVTSDGKVRSSSVNREPRGESPIEVLRRENDKLRREVGKYKAACQKLEEGLRLRVTYGELLESLLLWLTEEPEGSTDPTVDSTPQLEDGTIIDVTPEPETVSPALPAPVATTPETSGEQFELVMSKIEQSDGSEKSLNQLCGKNWAKYRKEMSEDQVSRIEEAARSKGLTVQTRNSGSKSKGE